MSIDGRDLSWEPVRSGNAYCSPGCGGKCKIDDFLKATKEAEKLASKLGNGFVPNVWENLGWHWSVDKGEISIRPPRYGSKNYSATYSNQFWVDAKTAKVALKLLLVAYKERLREAQEIAQEVEQAQAA